MRYDEWCECINVVSVNLRYIIRQEDTFEEVWGGCMIVMNECGRQ